MKRSQLGSARVLVAAAMCASLAACGGGGGDEGASDDDVLNVAVAEIAVIDVFDQNLAGFKKGMAASYDGEIEYSVENAQGDLNNVALIARRIVDSEPDVIYALGTPMVVALAKETKTIPIVFGLMTDPVDAGVVESADVPGGNVTGTSDFINPKIFLDYLRVLNPNAQNVAIIGNPGEPNMASYFESFGTVADEEGFEVTELAVAATGDILPAIRSQSGKVDGLVLPTDNVVYSALKTAVQAATEAGIPALAASGEATDYGAVLGLGIDWTAAGVLAGELAVEIMDGADPGSMPVTFLAEDEASLQVTSNVAEVERLGLEAIEVSE